MSNKKLAVYIHVPFCKSKCLYCDFLSFSGLSGKYKQYFNALEEEIISSAKKFTDYEVTSVFIGGGTPTLAPSEYICNILSILSRYYNVSFSNSKIETTIEANPETVDLDKLKALKSAGFNRISLGVQSLSDSILKRIGRVHNADTALKAYENARNAGFENINIDLMFSLPEQSMEDLRETLEKAVELKPEHISFYGLILEENSALSKDPCFVAVDDETDREMYWFVSQELVNAGYTHYEISNFAMPDMECRHNKAYWIGTDYIGFGLGAHSFVDGRRFHNTIDFDEYNLCNYSRTDLEILTEKDKQAEFMILGLRLLRGVSESEFFMRFRTNISNVYGKEVDSLISSGLLLRENGIIRLTRKGIDLSNMAFEKFI